MRLSLQCETYTLLLDALTGTEHGMKSSVRDVMPLLTPSRTSSVFALASTTYTVLVASFTFGAPRNAYPGEARGVGAMVTALVAPSITIIPPPTCAPAA